MRGSKKAEPNLSARLACREGITLRVLLANLRDVLRRRALSTLNDVELDALAFGQRPEAAALNRRMMDEAVFLASLRRDEAEALRVVEPLYCTRRAHFPNS